MNPILYFNYAGINIEVLHFFVFPRGSNFINLLALPIKKYLNLQNFPQQISHRIQMNRKKNHIFFPEFVFMVE